MSRLHASCCRDGAPTGRRRETPSPSPRAAPLRGGAHRAPGSPPLARSTTPSACRARAPPRRLAPRLAVLAERDDHDWPLSSGLGNERRELHLGIFEHAKHGLGLDGCARADGDLRDASRGDRAEPLDVLGNERRCAGTRRKNRRDERAPSTPPSAPPKARPPPTHVRPSPRRHTATATATAMGQGLFAVSFSVGRSRASQPPPRAATRCTAAVMRFASRPTSV